MYRNFIIKPISENTYEGIGFIGSKNKIKKSEFFPLLTGEDLKGKKVYLLLKPSYFFYEFYKVSLPTIKKKAVPYHIIKLHLQERIKNLGGFSEPFEIFWKIQNTKENIHELSYIAIPTSELLQHKNYLTKICHAQVKSIAFLPFTLLSIHEEESFIIIHGEKDHLWLILVFNHIPLFIEVITIDELIGININELNSRINFLKNYFLREFQKEVNTLVLHKVDININDLRDMKVIIVEKEYVEYFNILNIDPDYNFIPPIERAITTVLENNYKISYFFYLLSCVFLFLSLSLNVMNKNITKEIEKKNQLIQESIQRLLAEYPQEKLQWLKIYLDERRDFTKQPHPYELFSKFVHALENTKVTSFEIKKQGNSTYSVSLVGNLTIAQRDFNNFYQNFISTLSKFVKINNNKIFYSNEDNTVTFEIQGDLIL